jgi:hypothetical protein
MLAALHMKTTLHRLEQLEQRQAARIAAADSSGAHERLVATIDRMAERLRADADWESPSKPTVAEVRERLQEVLKQATRPSCVFDGRPGSYR